MESDQHHFLILLKSWSNNLHKPNFRSKTITYIYDENYKT